MAGEVKARVLWRTFSDGMAVTLAVFAAGVKDRFPQVLISRMGSFSVLTPARHAGATHLYTFPPPPTRITAVDICA